MTEEFVTPEFIDNSDIKITRTRFLMCFLFVI